MPPAELPIVEGFRVVAELGSGSLCSVYQAVEEPLGRTVALKLLRSTIPPDSPLARQLEHEAQTLSGLKHPNVGLLYSFVKTERRMLLVMEFVDGFSLAALLQRKATFPPDSVAAIGAAVARGLAHCHEHGVVHRDIKPANVLVSRHGEVKVFDFGIAQRAQANEPSTGARTDDVAPFGTPAYMSPEQILGEAVDARSDVFSLGVVLYQLLCGARPFERSDDAERHLTAQRIRRDPPIPLHRRAPDVPPSLERAVMRAIEKLPADRFPSAQAMAERLEELAAARGESTGQALVSKALAHARLAPAEPTTRAPGARRKRRTPARQAITGLGVLGALVVAAGAALQATGHREGQSAGARALELAPANGGFLRVLATPWAEVAIDGQHVEVTPFARPIPLAPGTHYVTLSHPAAPDVKRTIVIAPGETRTVDVILPVPDLSPKTEGDVPAPRADRAAP